MKEPHKLFFRVLALCLTAAILAGCSMLKTDEEKIEARIDSFLSAYNSGDMNEVLESFDSKTRNTYSAAMAIAQGIFGMGFDISDLFAVSIGTMSESDILTIEILEIDIIDDKTATVDVTLNYQDDTQQASMPAVITLIKESGDWYIQNIEDR